MIPQVLKKSCCSDRYINFYLYCVKLDKKRILGIRINFGNKSQPSKEPRWDPGWF